MPHPRFQNATIPLSTGLRQDENWMKRRLSIVWIAAVFVLGAIAFYTALHWAGGENSARRTALAMMPSDARSVGYADVAALRQTPFIAGLRDWAPTPQVD